MTRHIFRVFWLQSSTIQYIRIQYEWYDMLVIFNHNDNIFKYRQCIILVPTCTLLGNFQLGNETLIPSSPPKAHKYNYFGIIVEYIVYYIFTSDHVLWYFHILVFCGNYCCILTLGSSHVPRPSELSPFHVHSKSKPMNLCWQWPYPLCHTEISPKAPFKGSFWTKIEFIIGYIPSRTDEPMSNHGHKKKAWA